MPRFTNWFLATFASGIVLVFGFNAAVDPFEVFQWTKVAGWNATKYVAGSRQEKAMALLFDHYDGLVVGTSRAEVGYRPDHEGWRGRPVYSATLAGTNMLELEQVYDYAVERQRPEVVVFGLDFLLFGSARATREAFEESAFNPESRHELWLPRVGLSLFSLRKSAATIAGNRRGAPAQYVSGHRLGSRFAAPLSIFGHSGLFEKTIHQFLTNPELYNGYEYGLDRVESLRRVVAHARRTGTRLHLVINPVHALQLETIRAAGLWSRFEEWKRDLVRIAEGPGTAVPLWDFTGYSGPSVEPVPARGDRTTRMKWYFECSHFRRTLGDRVLERVLQDGPADPDFGIALASANLEAHLEGLRTRRELYVRERAGDVALVAKVQSDIAKRRRATRRTMPPPSANPQ